MKKLLMLGAAVVAVLSIATPTANAASTVRCGKIWRVDASVWVTVTDVGHRHNCRLSRKVARNVYSDRRPQLPHERLPVARGQLAW